MSQAFQGEASSGDSSRSSSPASEDIDMEGAPSLSKAHSSQNQLQAPLSPVSPQKNGGLPSGALNGGGVSTAGQRVSKQVNRNAQAGNRKRPGHSKHDSSSHMRDGEGSGYSRGLMDPAQGSAYERLLDLNYPRGN